MLRFKEARGRHYEDAASDSSWVPHEVKDLDVGHGSHIRPGKLKNAVNAGNITDVDNYFQVNQVVDVLGDLKKSVLSDAAQLKGHTTELMTYVKALADIKGLPEAEQDAEKMADLQAKVDSLNERVDGYNKTIAEKQDKVDELEKAQAEAARLKSDSDTAEAKAKDAVDKKAKAPAARAKA